MGSLFSCLFKAFLAFLGQNFSACQTLTMTMIQQLSSRSDGREHVRVQKACNKIINRQTLRLNTHTDIIYSIWRGNKLRSLLHNRSNSSGSWLALYKLSPDVRVTKDGDKDHEEHGHCDTASYAGLFDHYPLSRGYCPKKRIEN